MAIFGGSMPGELFEHLDERRRILIADLFRDFIDRERGISQDLLCMPHLEVGPELGESFLGLFFEEPANIFGAERYDF